MLYHPYIINIACIYLAAYIAEKIDDKLLRWFENLNNIDKNTDTLVKVSEVVQELLEMYDEWDDSFYDSVGKLITKFERANQLHFSSS